MYLNEPHPAQCMRNQRAQMRTKARLRKEKLIIAHGIWKRGCGGNDVGDAATNCWTIKHTKYNTKKTRWTKREKTSQVARSRYPTHNSNSLLFYRRKIFTRIHTCRVRIIYTISTAKTLRRQQGILVCSQTTALARLPDLHDLRGEDALSGTRNVLLRMGRNPLRHADVWHAVEEPSSFSCVPTYMQTHTKILVGAA